MTSKRPRRGGRRFIQLWTNVKRSQAYHDLSVYGRAALFELLDRYTGINNGMIGLGCRELSEALNCSRDTAAKALRELDDSGLARPLTAGVWRGKKATEWRLTFYRCDKTGELPILNWPPFQSGRKDAKVRVVGHKELLSPSGRTCDPKNSIAGSSVSPFGRTHIDIYQGGTVSEYGTESEDGPLSKPAAEGKKEGDVVDPRIVSLGNWGNNARLRTTSPTPPAWARPTILSDELRDFAEFPLEEWERAA